MKLKRLTDYALRVLIHIAKRPGRRCTVPEIARAHRISQHHLVKIVHLLGRLGYLETVRGRGGGVTLRPPASGVNLGDLVRSLERDDDLADCAACGLAPQCRLAGVLDCAKEAFYADLSRRTLADVVRPPLAA